MRIAEDLPRNNDPLKKVIGLFSGRISEAGFVCTSLVLEIKKEDVQVDLTAPWRFPLNIVRWGGKEVGGKARIDVKDGQERMEIDKGGRIL